MLLFQLIAQCAIAQTLGIFAPKQEGVYQEFVEAVKAEALKPPMVRLHLVEMDAAMPGGGYLWPADTVAVITVGVAATRRYLATYQVGSPPLITALVPRATFEQLLGGFALPRQKVTGLFLDQSFARQLELSKLLLPGAKKMGIVLGPQTQKEADSFRVYANSRGIQLNIEYAERESELYAALQSTMLGADAILLLPDPSVINPATAQNVLLTALRRRIPVFAFSTGYVHAGALAAVYSSPRQQGTEVTQIGKGIVRGGSVPPPRYPRQFGVAINSNLAAQLGLDVPTEAATTQRLGVGDVVQ